MRVRNNVAYDLLKDVKCPYCGNLLSPTLYNLDEFKGIEDETNKASADCVKFNELVNLGLCSDKDVVLHGVPFLEWLEQFRH